MKRVGIDIGSTTVKIAVLDDNNNILFSAYERHYANIQETLRAIMERAYNELGDCDIAPMITVPVVFPFQSTLIFHLCRKL